MLTGSHRSNMAATNCDAFASERKWRNFSLHKTSLNSFIVADERNTVPDSKAERTARAAVNPGLRTALMEVLVSMTDLENIGVEDSGDFFNRHALFRRVLSDFASE